MELDDCMDLIKIIEQSKLTNVEYVKWLQEIGLLTSSYKCPKCSAQMCLGVRSCLSDGVGWRCNKCKTVRSIRAGSWFSESKLTLQKIMLLTYMWCERYNQRHVVKDGRVAKNTVVDWFNFCREVCVSIVENDFERLGGEGLIVEIDESLFSRRKYNKRRKKSCQQWVFGGVERGSNKCFLVKVDKRDAATLIPIIEKYVLPGTTIYSDCWKAYDCLGAKGFNHFNVNHKITFKEGEVCTNTIEGMWRLVKKMFPEYNRQKGHFDSYLAEFMYRRKAGNCHHCYFLESVKEVYKVRTEDVVESGSESD